jgi:hypothetical protein
MRASTVNFLVSSRHCRQISTLSVREHARNNLPNALKSAFFSSVIVSLLLMYARSTL